MSKTKEIISIEHTLKEVLKNLSDQDIQEITGKSKSYIYKCADPDDHDRHIHFKDVVALEQAMQPLRLAWKAGCSRTKKSQPLRRRWLR